MQQGHKVRPTAVDGMFYPGDAQTLSTTVAQLLRDTSLNKTPEFKALISPHAGYVYSGPIAAEAYAPLKHRAELSRVVLLGPSHRVPLQGMAIPSVDVFSSPLGEIPLDINSLAALRNFADVAVNDEAHRLEHSLEVQLPFLQAVLLEFVLVPVVVGYCAVESVRQVLEFLWEGRETLVVVSSDLSHYLSYADAQSVDSRTAKRILAEQSSISGEEACGCYALNGLLAEVSRRRLRGELIALANSGDTAGDKSRVVGYGAFGFH